MANMTSGAIVTQSILWYPERYASSLNSIFIWQLYEVKRDGRKERGKSSWHTLSRRVGPFPQLSCSTLMSVNIAITKPDDCTHNLRLKLRRERLFPENRRAWYRPQHRMVTFNHRSVENWPKRAILNRKWYSFVSENVTKNFRFSRARSYQCACIFGLGYNTVWQLCHDLEW